MKLPKHPALLRRMRDARVKQLPPRCPPLAASLGRQAGGGYHLTLKRRGKTRTVYFYCNRFTVIIGLSEPIS